MPHGGLLFARPIVILSPFRFPCLPFLQSAAIKEKEKEKSSSPLSAIVFPVSAMLQIASSSKAFSSLTSKVSLEPCLSAQLTDWRGNEKHGGWNHFLCLLACLLVCCTYSGRKKVITVRTSAPPSVVAAPPSVRNTALPLSHKPRHLRFCLFVRPKLLTRVSKLSRNQQLSRNPHC